jgi:hypothetical protein
MTLLRSAKTMDSGKFLYIEDDGGFEGKFGNYRLKF